jgi:hypothetical protein
MPNSWVGRPTVHEADNLPGMLEAVRDLGPISRSGRRRRRRMLRVKSLRRSPTGWERMTFPLKPVRPALACIKTRLPAGRLAVEGGASQLAIRPALLKKGDAFERRGPNLRACAQRARQQDDPA